MSDIVDALAAINIEFQRAGLSPAVLELATEKDGTAFMNAVTRRFSQAFRSAHADILKIRDVQYMQITVLGTKIRWPYQNN